MRKIQGLLGDVELTFVKILLTQVEDGIDGFRHNGTRVSLPFVYRVADMKGYAVREYCVESCLLNAEYLSGEHEPQTDNRGLSLTSIVGEEYQAAKIIPYPYLSLVLGY